MIPQILAEEILAGCSQNHQSAKISGHTVYHKVALTLDFLLKDCKQWTELVPLQSCARGSKMQLSCAVSIGYNRGILNYKSSYLCTDMLH